MTSPNPVRFTDTVDHLSARLGQAPLAVARALQAAGYDAVVVGGPVRDLLHGATPNDVDLATNATPTQVRSLLRDAFGVGAGEAHGTLHVPVSRLPGGSPDAEPVQVTTYRQDIATDGRRAVVAFATDLETDLARRDFTINAIAIRPTHDAAADVGVLVDPFGGAADLATGVLRAVGDPAQRFLEDYLRVLRGYRFAARFGLTIEPATRAAMRAAVPGMGRVSRERIREELEKLLAQTTVPGRLEAVLRMMHEDGLLALILPEVAACSGVTQNGFHAYDVLTHLLKAADAAGPGDWRKRFTLLVHDIGKPATRSVDEDGNVHFYGHEDVGAELADTLCKRLTFSSGDRTWVVGAVALHMRLHAINRGEVTARALRKLARDLRGGVTLEDLLDIRVADKLGSGREEAQVDVTKEAQVRALIIQMREVPPPTGVAMLAVTGRDVIETLGVRPGPVVGQTLTRLLDAVVEDPALNARDRLLAMIAEAGRTPAAGTRVRTRQELHLGQEGGAVVTVPAGWAAEVTNAGPGGTYLRGADGEGWLWPEVGEPTTLLELVAWPTPSADGPRTSQR